MYLFVQYLFVILANLCHFVIILEGVFASVRSFLGHLKVLTKSRQKRGRVKKAYCYVSVSFGNKLLFLELSAEDAYVA